jgi:hypothetical protein
MSVAEPVVLAESVKKKLKSGTLFIHGRQEYTNVKSVWVAL